MFLPPLILCLLKTFYIELIMTLTKKCNVIKKLVHLINYEVTGNASVLAQRLGISRSQLFIEIETIKSYGVDIQFDRSKKSFVFSGQKKIIVREPIVITDREDLSTINAGFFRKNRSVLFSGLYTTNFVSENSQQPLSNFSY